MELSKTKLSLYASLSSAKMRRRHSLFVAEGEKLVADTLGAFGLETLLAEPQWLESHPEALGVGPGQVRVASPEQMAKISTMVTPPPVMAVYRIPYEEGAEGAREMALKARKQLVLVLDGVQDPGNLGTIVRTADWFGVYDIMASPDTADIFNPKAVQATMGAISRVKVAYAPLEGVLGEAGEAPVYGTLLEGRDIYACPLTKHGFLVMGNEGKGISPAVRRLLTEPLLIPPYGGGGHGESLNVAAATAVALSVFRFGRGR